MRLAVMLIGTLFLLTAGGLVLLAAGAQAQHSGSEAASLHVEVRDAGNRQRVAARCYLTDESGKPWTPAGAFTYDKRQEHHFITQGTFDRSGGSLSSSG
jgi:hypothetical protein